MPQAAIVGLITAGTAAAAKIIAAKTLAAVTFKVFATNFFVGAATSLLLKEFSKKPSQPSALGGGSRGVGSNQRLTGSVIPKRWVVGRARVEGIPVWIKESDNDFYMVLAISEGSCDRIERLWVQGEEVEIDRTPEGVITPAQGSRYLGTRTETWTETYYESVPENNSPDGPAYTPPSGPGPSPSTSDGRASACGGCRSSYGCGGSAGAPGAPGFSDIHDGYTPAQNHGRSLNMFGDYWNLDIPLRDLMSWNPAVRGTAGGAASGGVSGQQGEHVSDERRPPRRSGYRVVRRTRTRSRTVPNPLITITEFFSANGREGKAIRDIAGEAGEDELPWTDRHRGQGVSYVLVHMHQPDYTDIDDRFWPNIPSLQFLVKGIKIGYPVPDGLGFRLTDPEWTENAAIIRAWFLKERRNRPYNDIDLTYFDAARRLCDEEISLTDEDGFDRTFFPSTAKRYTINGVITATDSAAQLEAQFDFAWQGFVVESSGKLLFRPGTQNPHGEDAVKLTIPESDVIDEPTVRPFGARSDLANEVSLEILQSAQSDYQSQRFVHIDREAQMSDGERLVTDLQTQHFVNNTAQVGNFLTQRLRQQRHLVGVDIKVKSPADWRYIELIPGDRIELNLPQYGIGTGTAGEEGAALLRYFRVVTVTANPDYSVDLNLLEWPDNLFDDSFDLPAPVQKFDYRPRNIRAPSGVIGNIDWNITRDGRTEWTAFLAWDSSPYLTVINADAALVNTEERRTRDDQISFTLSTPGRYFFSLYHISSAGVASAQTQVVLDATYDDIPLPKPVIQSQEQIGNTIIIRIQNVLNRDIDGMEVRYTRGAVADGFSTLPTLDESNWDDALEMIVAPVVPRDVDQPIIGTAVMPGSGSYRIYVRLRNRVGNLSPISNDIFNRYEIAATSTDSRSEQPLWANTKLNTILWPHDGENRLLPNPAKAVTEVTMSEWDGSSDFPFGEITGKGAAYSATGSTAYTSQIINLDNLAEREIWVGIESAAAKTPAVAGFELTLLYSTEADLASPQSRVVTDGSLSRLTCRSFQARVHFKDTVNHALIAATIGWRNLT